MERTNSAAELIRRHEIAKLIAIYTAAKNQNVPQHARRIARIRFNIEDLSEADFEAAAAELASEALRAIRAAGVTANPSTVA